MKTTKTLLATIVAAAIIAATFICTVSASTTVSVPAAPVGYAVGDVNGDGSVTVYDALIILRTLVGLETILDTDSNARIRAAVVSGAPEANISGALEILRDLVGLPTNVGINRQLIGNGTRAHPYNWDQLASVDGVTIRTLEGGYALQSKDSENRWNDIWVRVCGNWFGNVEYSQLQMDGPFISRSISRGETMVIRLFEGSFWLQQEPVQVTNLTFGTSGMRRADASGFGWVFTPDTPLEFVVSEEINVIQAWDSRVGQVREFRPGQTAYIGREGATIWFANTQPANSGPTTYTQV